MPPIVGWVDEPLVGQQAQDLLDVLPTEGFLWCERQLECRALDVIDQDVRVVRIDERVLGRGVEEIRRIAHDELIERRARRHENRRRSSRPASGAARPLPRRGDGPRVARQDGHVQRADIDAKLQGVGRHDRPHAAFPEPPLDLPAAVGKVPPAIPADEVLLAGPRRQRVLQVGCEELGGQTALRKHDDLQPALEELEGDPPRLREIGAPDPELLVDDGRVDEHEELLPPRRAAVLDELEAAPGQALRQLPRVGNRRRRADEHRV